MKQLFNELGIGDWKAKHFIIAFYITFSVIIAVGITVDCPALLIVAIIINLINAIRLSIKYAH